MAESEWIDKQRDSSLNPFDPDGLYSRVSQKMVEGADTVFGVTGEDLDAASRSAFNLVDALEDQGFNLDRKAWNAAQHMFLANVTEDSGIRRAALQGKEYVQQFAGDVGSLGAVFDRKNNALGFQLYDQAGGDEQTFKKLVAENLLNRFGKNAGIQTHTVYAKKGKRKGPKQGKLQRAKRKAQGPTREQRQKELRAIARRMAERRLEERRIGLPLPAEGILAADAVANRGGFKKGGSVKVRGSGIATQGVRPAKMVKMKGS